METRKERLMYMLSNWKYYLQFFIPLRFKTKCHKATKENAGCIWWMWGGKCFNIKWGVSILIAAFILTGAGCKTQSGATQKVTEYYQKHCAEDSKIERRDDGKFSIRLTCKDIHDTTAIKKYADNIAVCYSPTGGDFKAIAVSKDSIPDIWGILKAIAKGVKK